MKRTLLATALAAADACCASAGVQKPAANNAENNTLRVFMTPPSRVELLCFWARGTARTSLAYACSLSGTRPNVQV